MKEILLVSIIGALFLPSLELEDDYGLYRAPLRQPFTCLWIFMNIFLGGLWLGLIYTTLAAVGTYNRTNNRFVAENAGQFWGYILYFIKPLTSLALLPSTFF